MNKSSAEENTDSSLSTEETGQVPSCMFCGAQDGCDHLVAVIDRSFLSCEGGALYIRVDQFRDIVACCLQTKLSTSQEIRSDEIKDFEFRTFISESIDLYDPEYPDDVDLDGDLFFTWLIEALLSAGAEEPHGCIVDEGGPGQSSAITLLYAQNPELVLQKVEISLRELVSSL